jgi:uncharacterized membrane protein YhfC
MEKNNAKRSIFMKTKNILILVFTVLLSALALTVGIRSPDTIMPAINAFLMIAIGLSVGFYMAKKFNLPWGIFGAGVLTFIGSQVLHIPFNQFVLNRFLANQFPQPQPLSQDLMIWGALLGLSAGLFEETGRYLVIRFWRKDVDTWKKSIMLGAGHGGIEAILVGMIAFISFLQLIAYRQMDLSLLAESMESTQYAALQNALTTFWGFEWYEYLWGAFERMSVLPFHIAASVLVYRSVRDRKILWYLLAVGLHTLLDFFAVFASQSWGIPQTELTLFFCGLLSVGIIFLLREKDPAPEPADEIQEIQAPPLPQETVPVPDGLAQDKPITLENLEESKYD